MSLGPTQAGRIPQRPPWDQRSVYGARASGCRCAPYSVSVRSALVALRLFDALRLQGETGFREKPGVPASLARALPWLSPAHWDALATAGLHCAAPEAPYENALARLRLSSRKERFLANALNPPDSCLHQGGGQAQGISSEDPRGPGHTPTLPTAVLPGPELGSPALQR